MGIKFTIDHKARYVEARAEDVVDLKDVEAFLDAVVVQDALRYRKLLDGRGAVPKYTNDDVMALGARVSAYAQIEQRGALALVAGTDEHFELAARFINLGKSDRPAKVFRSVDDARKWLEAQPEV